jgi:hypothetical protein
VSTNHLASIAPTRDWAAEMRKHIDDARQEKGGYNASTLAAEIVDKLKGEDRELLYGWLEAHAQATIRDAIKAADAATRAYARHSAPRSAFQGAAMQAASGNTQPLRLGFLQAVYVVNPSNDRKQLRDMTANDVEFVADSYDRRSKSAAMEAAFFRILTKNLGDQRVGDVYSNDQLAELRLRVIGK